MHIKAKQAVDVSFRQREPSERKLVDCLPDPPPPEGTDITWASEVGISTLCECPEDK